VADISRYRQVSDDDARKAAVFFQHASVKAGIGQFEYAIEMWMQGFALDPDNVEEHQKLREVALKRKASGGKDMGMFDKMKLKRPTKDDKENMLNAEKMLSYNPGDVDLMISVLQNAHRAGCWDTCIWMAPIALKANAESNNPSFHRFIVIKDIMASLEQWKLATDACHYAAMLRPDDMDLQTELKNLGAQHTMSEGKYGTAKSFRDSVRDAKAQEKLLLQDKDVRTEDQMTRLLREAEEEWKKDPNEPGKLMRYVEALEKMETLEFENQALEVLDEAYKRTKAFRFRHRAGQIQMKQMNRQERAMLQELRANPNDEDLRKEIAEFRRQKLEFELEEFRLWADAYPTETRFRYEMALRLYHLGRFDEAIPVLQNVRNDPKFRADAAIWLGRAFLDSGYIDESAETLESVINDYQLKGDDKSKEMYYWRGRALEQKGDRDVALKLYSQVAQWDFNYRDVQKRLKELRAKPASA
jgi:TolA-binding protein